MRVFFATVIVLAILYFLGGWGAVLLGLIPEDAYFQYAGIVGGLASVVGLLSLARPPLTTTDLQDLEVGSLESITELSKELQSLEVTRASTQEEIKALELQKKEMALLVRKASLTIFLTEQYSSYERRIIEAINDNPDLQDQLERAREVSEKLTALNEDIEKDPRVEQLREIIAAAQRQRPVFDEILVELPPLVRASFLLSRELTRTLNNIIENLTR